MFPEDYFKDISIYAIYGYRKGYELYNTLNENITNHPFYINNKTKFEKTNNYEYRGESFYIGISCNDDCVIDCTHTLCYKGKQYIFIFDGIIENKDEIISKLESKGVILANYGNACLFSYLFIKTYENDIDKLNQLKGILKGSYNFLVKCDDRIIAGTSINSKKKLLLGKLDNGGLVITDNYDYLTFFNTMFIRELHDDECISIYDNQIISDIHKVTANIRCALDYTYRTNITSKINDINIYHIKKGFVNYMNKEDSDIVTSYPTHPITFAVEYAKINNLEFKEVACKYNEHIIYIDQNIKNKRIVLIIENLSKITKIKKFIEMLYQKGAREIHLKVLSPMLNHSCPYEMNDMCQYEMIFNEKGIQEYLCLSSLQFLLDEQFMLTIKQYDKTSKICLRCINNI